MRIGGLIVTGVGVFFLLVNFDLIPDMGKMWPVLPIIVGVSLLVTSFGKAGPEDKDQQRKD